MEHIRNEKGVISLEACIVVPVFMLLMIFCYGFIVMFTGQNTLSHALVQTAESLALDSYALERMNQGQLDDDPTVINDIPLTGELLSWMYGQLFNSGNDFSSTSKWYKDNATVQAEAKKRFIAFLSAGDEAKADAILEHAGITGGVDAIDFTECTVIDGVLTLKITFNQDFVYDFQGLASFERTLEIKTNMWGL